MDINSKGSQCSGEFVPATTDETAGGFEEGEDRMHRYGGAGAGFALAIYRDGPGQDHGAGLRTAWRQPALPYEGVKTLSFRHV